MNKKYYCMFLAATACALSANAEVLTPQQAYEAASARAKMSNTGYQGAPQSAVPVMTVNAAGEAAVYLFAGDKGCLVASAESETPALLGYIDTPLVSGEEIPDAMRYWLDYYANEIRQLRQGNVRHRLAPAAADYASVEPFVKTKWNQGEPYNNMCPMLNSSRSVTGCVATGMAQAMKVFNWPEQGKGEISYRWTNGGEVLSTDFSESVYAWDKMLDNYYGKPSREERTAVATLMRDCGYSVYMNYSPSASGASDIYIASALYDFFGYDRSIRFEQRDNFYTEQWEAMVYEDVSAGRPVIYCGSGEAGGHCFVCDGYSTDGYFHFNWGWGGVSDGYFRLSALAPGVQGIGGNDGNFNSNQSIIASMRRPVADSKLGVVLAAQWKLVPQRESYTSGSTIRFGNTRIYNFSVEDVTGVMGLKLIPAQGDPVYVQGSTSMTFGTVRSDNFEQSNFRVPFENMPTSGVYSVEPALYSDGEWHDVEMSRVLSSVLQCEIADGVVNFTPIEAPARLDVTSFNVTSPVFSEKPFSVEFTANNPGTMDYYGDLVLVLTDDEGSVTNTSYFNVDLPAGESTERQVYTKFLTHVSPGTYNLYLINRFSEIYAGPVVVNIEEAPEQQAEAKLSDLKVTNATSTSLDPEGDTVYTVDPSSIKIAGNVTCTQGYLCDPIRAYIFHTSGGTSLAGMGQSFHLLEEGATAPVSFEGSYPDAEDAREYMIAFFLNGQQMDTMIYVLTDKTGSATLTKAGELDYSISGDVLTVNGTEGDIRTRVYSADGTLVVDSTGTTIDLSAAKSGVYMVVVTSGNKAATAKILR